MEFSLVEIFRLRAFNQLARRFRARWQYLAIVVALMGLGIGSAGACFVIFEALIIRPLMAYEPDSLVLLARERAGSPTLTDFRYDVFEALETSNVFESVAASIDLDLALRDTVGEQRATVQFVSESYFQTFGVAAQLGRHFREVDETSPLPAVLSAGLWSRRYSRNREVLGSTVFVGGQPFAIVGVSPDEFNGVTIDRSPDIRVPINSISLGIAGVSQGIDDLLFDIVGRVYRDGSVVATQTAAESIFRRGTIYESNKRGSGRVSLWAWS